MSAKPQRAFVQQHVHDPSAQSHLCENFTVTYVSDICMDADVRPLGTRIWNINNACSVLKMAEDVYDGFRMRIWCMMWVCVYIVQAWINACMHKYMHAYICEHLSGRCLFRNTSYLKLQQRASALAAATQSAFVDYGWHFRVGPIVGVILMLSSCGRLCFGKIGSVAGKRTLMKGTCGPMLLRTVTARAPRCPPCSHWHLATQDMEFGLAQVCYLGIHHSSQARVALWPCALCITCKRLCSSILVFWSCTCVVKGIYESVQRPHAFEVNIYIHAAVSAVMCIMCICMCIRVWRMCMYMFTFVCMCVCMCMRMCMCMYMCMCTLECIDSHTCEGSANSCTRACMHASTWRSLHPKPRFCM